MFNTLTDRRARFPAIALALSVAAACAPAAPPFGPPVKEMVDVPVIEALLPDSPALALASFAAVCAGPGDALVRLGPRAHECRIAMTPEMTAWAILTHDGMIEDLPRIVVNIASRKIAEGDTLGVRTYIRVPQRRGAPTLIPLEDPALTRRLVQVLQQFGGTPLPG